MATARDSSKPLESMPADLKKNLLEWYATSERPMLLPEAQLDVTPENHTMDELVKFCLSTSDVEMYFLTGLPVIGMIWTLQM